MKECARQNEGENQERGQRGTGAAERRRRAQDDSWAAGTWGTEALRGDVSIMGWVGGRRLMLLAENRGIKIRNKDGENRQMKKRAIINTRETK